MLGLSGIVRIFEEIEQRLVQSLRRNLSRHKEEEEQEEKQWSAWQAEKLRSLEKFRRENAAIMAEYTEQIDQETRQIMEEEFSQGVNSMDVPPAVPVEDAPAEIHPEPQFFGVDRTKVDKLIEDVTTLEKNAETAALRLTDDVYRQTVNRVQLAMSTGSMTLQQAIDIAVKDFLNQGINCIIYRDGRRVNIADYVRMALRTTATRAALQGKSAKFKSLGYDTVQVSSYGMCSKTCEPWQGRIYIEDTFSFWDGEVQEYPDGILWGKSGYCGKWFPLLSSAIEKGLFHPNCRHTILLWRDGDPLPESVDNSDSERRYKLEQQQRALEREIRKAKRKVNGFTDPENVRKAKAELKVAQKKLKDFIDKVNAEEGETVLRRDEGKEKVYEGEAKPEYKTEPPVSDSPVPEGKAVEVTVSEPENAEGAYTEEPISQAENVNNPSIDNSEENDIIRERGKLSHSYDDLQPFGKKSKIGSDLFSVEAKTRLSECENEIRNNRNERAIVFNPDGTEQLQKDGDADSVTFSYEERRKMKGCILTHNHPDRSPFSPNDIAFLLRNGLSEIRVCFRGGTYILQRTELTTRKKPSVESVKNAFYEEYKRIGNKYNDIAAQNGKSIIFYLRQIDESTVDSLANKYKLNFRLEVDRDG